MSTLTPSQSTIARRATTGARPAARSVSAVTAIDPFRVLRRYWVAIVMSAVLGAVLGAAAWILLLRFYPLYRSHVYFEIRPGLKESTDIGANDLLQDQLVFRLANTETMLLMDRQVLRQAVLAPATQRTFWFKESFTSEGGMPLIDEAVDELEEDVRTSVIRGSNLFMLTWATHRADDVPIVLDQISNAYLTMRQKQDEVVYVSNKGAFTRQVQATTQELEDINSEMEAFIRNHDMGTLDDARYSQIAVAAQHLTEQIGEINQNLVYTMTAFEQTSKKLTGVLEPSAEDKLEAEQDRSVAVHDQAILDIKTALRTIRDKYTEPDHPRILELENRLRAYEAEREEKIEDIIMRNLQAQQRNLQNEIQRFQRLLEDLEAEQEQKSTELRELAADQSTYRAMEMRRAHLESTLENDRQLMKEVELMRLREEAGRVSIAIGPSTPREVDFPKPEIVIPFGALLLLALSVGGIFLRELTDRRIRSASDLMVVPHARIVGVIPELAEDPTKSKSADLVVQRHPNSVLAESYRQAWTNVARDMDRSGHQTLLVVGCVPESGSTTAITNLAAASAASGKRVLIVDANFRRSRLADVFEVDGSGPGLGDILCDFVTLEETILDAGQGVHVMPAGTEGNRIIERLNNGRLDTIIAQLRARYDLVIFDAPPAVVAGDAMIVANKVDAAILVVRANREHRGLVGRLLNGLLDAQCEVLGLLLNRPRGTVGGYFKENFEAMASYTSSS